MATQNTTAESKPAISPYGKIMGIVDTKEQLQAVSAAASKEDLKEFRILSGNEGTRFLRREDDTVSHFVLGDMEPKMVERYLAAVENGKFVFVAAVDSDKAEEIAEAFKAQGATQITHFGEWVITNY